VSCRRLPAGALAVALALVGAGCGASAVREIRASDVVVRGSDFSVSGSGRAVAAVEALLTPILFSVVERPARRAEARRDSARVAVRRHVSSTRPAVAHVATAVRAAAPLRGAVSVWLPYWDMPAAEDSALANAGVVGTASPFWYGISGDSRIESDPGAGDASIVDGLRARGLEVVPTVTETAGMRDFDRMLASASRRAAMVRALIMIARSGDYAGLDLDFEEFAVDRAHQAAPADEAAAAYPAFVGQACGALHAIGLSCTVTIMPRTSAAHVYWRNKLATWVYDYGALAAVADLVQVMAYDEHAPGTAPGPVAPYPWVIEVVRYARATMPPGKVELALPAYGYDWSRGQATSITSRQAAQLALEVGAPPSWSAAQAEETFRYGSRRRRHVVWYENGAAEYDRARLAKAAGFAGVDLWYAGGEDPAVWPLLRGLYAR